MRVLLISVYFLISVIALKAQEPSDCEPIKNRKAERLVKEASEEIKRYQVFFGSQTVFFGH